MYQPTQEAGGLVNINAVFNATKNGIEASERGKKTYSYSSAASAASKLVAIFPLLCSRTVSADTASMMTKYIEAKGCSLLQMVLSASNISNDRNAMEYLAHYHQNLNIGGIGLDALQAAIGEWLNDVASAANDVDNVVNNGLTDTISDKYNKYRDIATKNENSVEFQNSVNAIMNCLEEMYNQKTYTSELNPVSLNDYTVNDANGSFSIKLNEAYKRPKKKRTITGRGKTVSILKDQDVKKMNSALPTLLQINFYRSATDNHGTTALIGIKGVLIPVNTTEILRRIANDNEDGRYFLNFMRALTGETSFIKDFLLNLSRTEEDIKNIKTKGSYGDTWELLKNRAQAASMAVKQGRENQFSAVTTVVVSKEDADSLYKEENIDITDPVVAKHFMKSYNLLGFAIVDDVLESVKIMFDDGNTVFEELAYKMLERENSDSSILKTINLMNKMK